MWRLAILLMALALAAPGETVTGLVVDEDGRAIEGARVRLRAAAAHVVTGTDGRFVLADPRAAPGGEITAALPGHLIGGATLRKGVSDYRLTIRTIPPGDDPTYPWVTAYPEDDQAPRTDFGREPCGACHRRILAEWQESAHARSAVNPRFLASLTPESRRSGGCAACHVPMAAANDARTDPLSASGAAAEGVGCDLCHKSADAPVARAGRIGVHALDLRRPPFGHQAIFGPFDDVPRGRDVFAPTFSESRFCAACHQSADGELGAYSEFEEWRASRYAAAGITCQSCHMRGDGGATAMTDLGPGRIERDAATLSSHRFHDGRVPGFIADAVDLELTVRREEGDVVVAVAVTNTGAGHHLPAGAPMRHMLLVVAAETAGTPLPLAAGPTLPPWAGPDLAGRPGRAYAKLLRGQDGRVPAPHWSAIAVVEDSRLGAGSTDRQTFRFASAAGDVSVTARLLVRRTFAGWAGETRLVDDETIVAERTRVAR